METVKLNELPSSARLRLSQRYASGAADDENRHRRSLASPRQSSILNSSLNIALDDLLEDEDDVPPPPVATGRDRLSRGVSILARQASGFSRAFALSSTSDTFQKNRIW